MRYTILIILVIIIMGILIGPCMAGFPLPDSYKATGHAEVPFPVLFDKSRYGVTACVGGPCLSPINPKMTIKADTPNLNLFNDKTSSIHVPEGKCLICYDNINYQGSYVEFRSDAPDLYNFNNKISSIKVLNSALSQKQIRETLGAHNKYRADVGVPPLTWSCKLAASAQQCANQIAAMGYEKWTQQPRNKIHCSSPENQGAGDPSQTINQIIDDQWGSEKKCYFNKALGCEYGHYSNMIDPTFHKVGCARVHCVDGWDAIVCQYSQ